MHCFDPDGTLIGKILIPEIVANVTFGGAKRNRLFICGTTSLYAVAPDDQRLEARLRQPCRTRGQEVRRWS